MKSSVTGEVSDVSYGRAGYESTSDVWVAHRKSWGMPPKRKAEAAVYGALKAERSSRASTPGAATPRCLDSTDEVEEDDEPVDAVLERDSDKTIDLFSLDHFQKRHAVRELLPHISGDRDFSDPVLKKDHQYQLAHDFLTMAESLSRPMFMHERALATHSLHVAVSVGIGIGISPSPTECPGVFSQDAPADEIRSFITSCTQSHGRVKLVLKNTKQNGLSQGLEQQNDQAVSEGDVFLNTLNEEDDDDQEVTHSFEVAGKDVELSERNV
ncbi:DNA repair helicase RAD25 [Metarhizium album ARSEF 1941]|uniref:DNA repair helicase RAD25 n=1 Tax=Metarhizium album (strain ARSEF 1941) TaxID=1081103 RepID=A0A0B2WZN6_METAS|nr:DNA repair helicase RAD25 [Metarhizium album ARSEF 1941]KHN99518.1 DNA repair helicase RAD25 [Metarhizium album ARSEF 1941]